MFKSRIFYDDDDFINLLIKIASIVIKSLFINKKIKQNLESSIFFHML